MAQIYKFLLMWMILVWSIPFTAHANVWGYITMTVGDTRTLKVSEQTESTLRMVGEANIKSYEWDSEDWTYVQVTSQEWWTCNIKALRPCEDVKVTFKCKYRAPGKTYDESMEHCYYIDVKEYIAPTSIDLNYTDISLEVNGTRQLTATVKPAGAPQSVEWKVVSGSSYASVSSSGLVTAKAPGTATIRATSSANSSVYKDCSVTVTNPPTSISLNSTDVSLEVGQTKQLTVTASPSGASKEVTWKVISGSSYASVDDYGLVKAKAVGSATIRATSKLRSSVYADCSVTIKEATPTGISLSNSENLLVGERKKLTAKVLPNGASQDVIWSVVSGESLASVDSYGYVTAEAAGTAIVRATSKVKDSVYKDCTINITIPPTEIILPPSATVAVGEKITLTPEFVPSDAWAEHTWTTEDNTIAIVSSNGEVTGKAEGITTITVTTCNGKSDSCQVWVVPRYQMGDVFTAETEEGIEMKFKVTDTQARTCCVFGDYSEPAIPKSTNGNITIPSRANGYPVVSIGEHAFKECGNLTSVFIPKGVTTIGESAFEDCSSLTSITLPENVTSIGNYAFYGCNSLTSVIAEMENPATIGKNTFSNRKNATLYVLANSKAAYEAESYWNEFKEIIGYVVPTAITLPSSTIVEIGETITLTPGITPSDALTALKWTSEDESIATVSTSGEVTSIGVGTTTITVTTSNGLSASCQLKVIPKYQDGEMFSVQTEEGVEMKFQVISTQTYTCRVYGTNSEAAIAKSTEGSITIPSEANGYKVTSIGESAFRSCSGLTSVSIPEGITDIGNSAFLYCSNLTSVTIPNGVTDIGRDAFVYCSSLTSVTIPESVTSIGSSAFRYCDNLASVTVGMVTPIEIEERTFTNRENAILYVPSGSREAYLTEDYWKDFKEIVVEPTSIKLSESSITINVGESFTLSYTLTPSDATMNLLWTSSDEAIATVSSSGEVTGVHKGSTMIGVEAPNGLSDSCLVTVQPTDPTAISLPNNSTFIEVGESITLSPIITPSYAETTLSWTSDDTNIASVTSDGVVEGISEGKTTITVTTSNGLSVSCEVTVVHVFQYDELFTALTEEGVEVKFRVTRRTLSQEKTCEVFGGYDDQSGYYPAISTTTTGHVTIPSQVNGFIVNAIGNKAFYDCSGLTSVTIPESVASIGNQAFRGCRGLTSFTIPEGVTHIEGGAFEECYYLTSITLPNKLKSIGDYAFDSCYRLTSITIPNSVTSIGQCSFNSCSSLTSITIPKSVTNIGNRAFSGCSSLASIKVEVGNTTYDSRENCNAIIYTRTNSLIVGCKNTIIPNDVTSIWKSAFYECYSLTSITIPNSVTSIEESAFCYCMNLKSITIPNSVTRIGGEAFYYCERLKSITIPNSITSIDVVVFAHCTSLTSVTIPESVTNIAGSAFYGCTSLTSVTIPKSITRIGSYAFAECNSLSAVAVKMDTPAAIDKDAFSNRSEATLYVPAGRKAEYEAAEYWKDFKEIIEMECLEPTSITLPEFASVGTGEIKDLTPAMTPEYAWAWTSLTWASEDETIATVSSSGEVIGISEGTTTITATTSNGLFASCQVSVVQPTYIQFADTRVKDRCVTYWDTNGDRELSLDEASAVTRLETVFESKSNITSFNELMYFTGLKEIGNYAFYDCSSLKSINIPEGVTRIGYRAFSGCSSLKSINIPEGVTSIGDYAFYNYYNYSGLTTVVAEGRTPATIESNTFSNPKYITLYVPKDCKAVYEAAEYWKDFKEIIEMTPLTSITLPEFASVGTGEILTLTPITNPEHAWAWTSLTWTSEDENIAAVSSSGIVTGISEGSTTITVTTFNGLSASCQVSVILSTFIQFADAEVKELCVANWDTNGDGELSDIEASAVTSLGNVFKSNYSITSFDELRYFTGLKEINADAFENCYSLTSITIPNSITSIGRWAFYGCRNLMKVIVPDIAAWCNISFGGGFGNPFYYTHHLFIDENTEITDLVIPNGVTSINDYAFGYCSSLTSVIIAKSVMGIGDGSFEYCNGLTSIKVEEGNKYYDSRNNCNAIISTTNNKLIVGCSTTIIPVNVTSIGSYAFRGCGSLTSITIPKNVNNIGYFAFNDCNNLTSIRMLSRTPVSIGEDTFTNRSNATLYVPSGSKADYEMAEYWKDFKEIIEMEYIEPTTITLPEFASVGTGETITLTPEFTPSDASSTLIWTSDDESIATVSSSGEVTGISEGTTTITVMTDNGLSASCQVTVVHNYQYGDIFAALTEEGVEMKFMVTNWSGSQEKTCRVYGESHDEGDIPAIPASTTGHVTIPVQANGYTVTEIYYNAFRGCSGITSVTIPNSVTIINNDAFYGCSGLTSITIPSSVTWFNSRTFGGYHNLTSIIVEEGNTKYDSRDNCNAIIETATNTLITGCQNTVIPISVTAIDYHAFEGCTGLTTITIPQNVTSINSFAFCHCSNLGSIVVENGNTVYDSRNNCNAIIETASNKLIAGCKNTIIPNSVTTIGSAAFCGSGLTSIVIPNSVITIVEEAFADCSDLTSVTIPNSVTRIGEAAFGGCSSLPSITIPASVTKIDREVVCYCENLTQIVVENGNTVYDSRDNCNAIIETASNTLIAGCKNTIIPNDVITIGRQAFFGCTGLTFISIPNSVTSIDGDAFVDCSNLTDVIIGNGVTTIEDELFQGCEKLTNVTFGGAITTIGREAFYGCKGITIIVFPNSVTSIGGEAFADCSNITDVIIGSSMTNIGIGTFDGCANLNNVYCYATEPPIAANSDYWGDYLYYSFDISHIEEHTTLHVPAESLETYRTTAPWSNFKNIVPLTENDPTPEDDPVGIKAIDNESFTPALFKGEGECYSLDGKKLNKPQKGINIIRYSDETTRKVLSQ